MKQEALKFLVNDLGEKTLLDILKLRAQFQPNKQAYIFLQDGETESGSLTYNELDVKARAIATHLQSFKGERALLLYPSGLEFITAIFGCLYAGVVAVPVYPPRRNHNFSRLSSIINDAQAKIALTTTSILTEIEKISISYIQLAQLKCVATDTIEINHQEFVPKPLSPDSLAFLQYTSGSTGTPKGVMVTHRNIIHNQQVIQTAFNHHENSIVVGWLPLFHDMGLVGHVLQPLTVGFLSILMPSSAFIQKPIRWLKAISKYKATTSGGPNFAYDLCINRIQSEQLANLDLSSWDLAYSGAEPLRAETLKLFGKKFSACGFDYSAFYPCYGMAEITLFATGGDKNKLPVIHRVKAKDLEQNLVVESQIDSGESQILVGVGHPYINTTVNIVNPDALTRCEPGQVGEIWVSGESVTSGYWNRPEATQETFYAYLKDTGEGPFLRTGDLGFLWNGELFVTGRIKDVIIIKGCNYYPQDIELSVEKSHERLRPNSGAAFSLLLEEEKLVVVQEVERNYLRTLNLSEVVEAIRKAVLEQHSLPVYAVVLIKTGTIPRTSSGKIQRHLCRTKFLENTLEVIEISQLSRVEFSSIPDYQDSEQTDFLSNNYLYRCIEDWLIKILKIDKKLISPEKSFSTYGLDSLTSAELAFHIEKYLNNSIKLPTNLIWEFPTIESLVYHLTNILNIPSENLLKAEFLKPQHSPNILSKNIFIISMRQLCFYDNYYPSQTINASLHIVGNLNIAALEKSINEIIRRHSILRAKFSVVDGKPFHATIAPSLTITLPIIDIRELSPSEKTLKSHNLIESNTLRPFDINSLPLIRTQLLYLEQDEYLFSFFIHHIIFDGFSIAIFVRELSVLYNAFSNEQPSPLAELPIQYADFARWEQQHIINSKEWTRCTSYWMNKLANAQPFLKFTEVPVLSPCTTYSFNLSTKLIKSLREMASKENVSLFILMLTAFKALLHGYTYEDDIIIGVRDANRIPSETQTLIGQFATRLFLRTKFSANISFRKLLIQVRDTYFEACKYNFPIISSGQPLIDCEPVLFNFIQIPSDVKYPNILQSRLIDFVDFKETPQDLSVRIIDEVDKVHGKVFYTNRLFNIDKIKNLFNSYCQLLEQVVCQAEINVSDLKFFIKND